MRTGSSRPYRRPSQIFVAVFSALSLVSVVGCADNSPVAAPTSTLPAQQPDGGSTDNPPEVAIPDYETDLDLDKEEKKAVEGALVAFVGYIDTINRVFSSGGKDTKKADAYARGESLKSLNSEAKTMRASNEYMAGEYKAYDLVVESVDLDQSNPKQGTVSVLFCTKDSEWSVVPEGEPLPSSAPKGLTMQHDITHADNDWKVANQFLRSKTCGSD